MRRRRLGRERGVQGAVAGAGWMAGPLRDIALALIGAVAIALAAGQILQPR